MTTDPVADKPDGADLERAIRRRLGPSTSNFVGLAVGMVVGDQRTVVGFGRTRTDGPTPDGRTSFQIGSVTKLFTSLLLADAVHRGEVALDQPVESLIPGIASHRKARPFTLLDLATHSAGLPRLPPGMRWHALKNRTDPYADITSERLVEALHRPPKDPPGARVRYSNFGAGVLGEALTRATGESFEDLVTTRVTGPLGMHDTTIGVATKADERAAKGHSWRGRPAKDWHLAALAGAGAVRSTANDLLIFLDAHLRPERTPLTEPIRSVLEPRLRAKKNLGVGLGWQILQQRGGPAWWWHNGGTGGFFSFVGMDPDTSTGVVVLTNSSRSVDRLGALMLVPVPGQQR